MGIGESVTGKVSAGEIGGSQPLRYDISVIIPTVGRSILRRCLRSIADGSELPGQVIVVDQSSNPEIRGWLKELEERGVETKHLPSLQTGKASAVNRGVECANTEFIAITDDDCLVAPDWLRNMRAHLKAHPSTVVTGRVEAAGDEAVPLVVTSMSTATYSRPRLKFDTLSGGNMGVALTVMNQVGLLDEDLRCSEDGEWAYRALRTGVQIKYTPDVVVFHYGWRDTMERQQRYREYAKGSGRFYGKYLRQGDWFIGLRAIVHYLRELRRLPRAAVNRNAEQLRRSWACLRWLVPGILAGFRSQSARVASKVNSNR